MRILLAAISGGIYHMRDWLVAVHMCTAGSLFVFPEEKNIFLLFQESIRNCLTFFLWDHATFHCNENVLALKNRATRKKMSSHAFCGGGGLPLKSTDGSWRREGAWREEAHNF